MLGMVQLAACCHPMKMQELLLDLCDQMLMITYEFVGHCLLAGSGDGQPVIALGGNKQASINIFNGRQLVDLREYYSAGALQQGSTGCDVRT
jgi:hypothetical protein